MSDIEFQKFPKIGRWSRPAIVTEKLDGTNAAVVVTESTGAPGEALLLSRGAVTVADVYAGPEPEDRTTYLIGAQSRKRLIQRGDDNFGFANWVWENATELARLGPGHHFGEWWGLGIQRGYGLDEKRFSLFNVHRWGDEDDRPTCCHVVPTLAMGDAEVSIDIAMNRLRISGSLAAPGFKNPEGVVIYHTANGSLFKKTFEGDDVSKYELEARRHEHDMEYGLK